MRFPMYRRHGAMVPVLIALALAGASMHADAAEAAKAKTAVAPANCGKTKGPSKADHSDPHKSMQDAEGCAKPKTKAPKLTQARTSDITYPNGDRSTRKAVDLTKLENIFGHADSKDDVTPWPGRQGSVAAIESLPQSGFICAAFTVPPNVRYFGTNGVGSQYSTPEDTVDIAYGEKCGDFEPKQKACLKLDVGNGESGPRWTTVDSVKGCMLKPGTHYWNLRTHARGDGAATVTLTNSFAKRR
jgi:hypothetical protein